MSLLTVEENIKLKIYLMNYSDYLAENLSKNIDSKEYVAENLSKSIEYSEYLAENIAMNISYSEYLAENLDNKRSIRKSKIKNLFD